MNRSLGEGRPEQVPLATGTTDHRPSPNDRAGNSDGRQGMIDGMTEPQDWIEEATLIERIEAQCAQVEAAYNDGGYAAGDGPDFMLDEVQWLLGQRRKALRIIEAWHQFSNHFDRIVTASPHMRAVDVKAALAGEYERIEQERRRDP